MILDATLKCKDLILTGVQFIHMSAWEQQNETKSNQTFKAILKHELDGGSEGNGQQEKFSLVYFMFH